MRSCLLLLFIRNDLSDNDLALINKTVYFNKGLVLSNSLVRFKFVKTFVLRKRTNACRGWFIISIQGSTYRALLVLRWFIIKSSSETSVFLFE